MKKQLLACFIMLFTVLHSATAPAQTTLYKFQKVFGRSNTDLVNDIKELSDGGYLLAGSTLTVVDTTTMETRQDMYVIKTDAAGNIKWSNIYGSSFTEAAFSIEEGPNGYYIFGNTISVSPAISFANLLHIDTAGHVIWNKTYSMYTNEWGATIKKVNDNAYMLCGKTYSPIEDYEIFLLKIDSSGNVIWGKGYNGDASMTDVAHALTPTSDGGFLITGDSYRFSTHDYYVMAIKTDSNGTAQWIKTYADTRNSRGLGGYETPDGGYIIGGQMVGTLTSADALLIRTTSAGDIVWSKTYGGNSMDMVHALVKMDTGYALIAESNSFFTTGITNGYIVKTDTSGNMMSSVTYGDSTVYSSASCAIATSHNGLAFGGVAMGYGPGLEDFYFVKTIGDSSGCFETPVATTASTVTIASNSFLNSETLTVAVTDITTSLEPGLDTLDSRSDSTHCFSSIVIPPVPTGIKPNAETGYSYIYPNPSAGNFTLHSSLRSNVVSVRIIDELGRDVSNQFRYRISGDDIHFTPKPGNAGSYWVRIADNTGNTAVCRLIIE